MNYFVCYLMIDVCYDLLANNICDQKEMLLRCLPAFATDVDWKTFSIRTNPETLVHICSL